MSLVHSFMGGPVGYRAGVAAVSLEYLVLLARIGSGSRN